MLGTRKEFLFGTWTEQAKKLAEGDDDFTKDIYELNAKSLVTTWASYPHKGRGGGLKELLQPSVGRSYTGLLQKALDDVDQSEKKAELKGESTQEYQLVCF